MAGTHDDDLRGRVEPELRRAEVTASKDSPEPGGLSRERPDQLVIMEAVIVIPGEVVKLLQDHGGDPIRRRARGVLHGLPFHRKDRGAGPCRRLEVEEPAALGVPEVF